MPLVPLRYYDMWDDFEPRHHDHRSDLPRLHDRYSGLSFRDDDFFDEFEPIQPDLLFSRPLSHHRHHRNNRRRFHPFFNAVTSRRGERGGASIIESDKNRFVVTLDVQQFAPDEIKVKVVEDNVVIEAKHEEKEDEHGWISRQFVRKYSIPSQCDADQLESRLSSDGILTITAPRKEPLNEKSNERIIKIQYTGQPAINECEDAANVKKGTEQKDQREQPRQAIQGRQPQQHGQRGRKGIVKAA